VKYPLGPRRHRRHDRRSGGYPGPVQTFLPFPDFARSVAVLDSRRLGKQRAETIQVLRSITVPDYGWRHHPAAKMWWGYAEALVRYGIEVSGEWVRRGNADTCAETLRTELAARTGRDTVRTQAELAVAGELPPWLGDDAFHRSHRSALIRKDPGFYSPVFEDVSPDNDDPYVWPPSDRAPVTKGTP
jgi:hypothetical protein